jgi:hypothetical protein
MRLHLEPVLLDANARTGDQHLAVIDNGGRHSRVLLGRIIGRQADGGHAGGGHAGGGHSGGDHS